MKLYELVRFSFQVCLIHVMGSKHVHHVHHSINLFEFVKTILVFFYCATLIKGYRSQGSNQVLNLIYVNCNMSHKYLKRNQLLCIGEHRKLFQIKPSLLHLINLQVHVRNNQFGSKVQTQHECLKCKKLLFTKHTKVRLKLMLW